MAEFLIQAVFWAIVVGYPLYVCYVLWGTAPAESSPVIDPAIRGEIEQTMEWWDGEFRKLQRTTAPSGTEHTAEHDMEETRTFGSPVVRRDCLECGYWEYRDPAMKYRSPMSMVGKARPRG